MNKLFIISAPTATGKTTLVNKLEKELSNLVRSISYTTRKPRKNEKEGVDYYFISEEEFKAKVEAGDFLEYAKVFGHYYGTSKEVVEKLRNDGKKVVLVIDVQGAMTLKDKLPSVLIFLKPPSYEELERRLRLRGMDSEEKIKERLKMAKLEMKEANKFDYQIVNDDLDTACKLIRSIIIKESI